MRLPALLLILLGLTLPDAFGQHPRAGQLHQKNGGFGVPHPCEEGEGQSIDFGLNAVSFAKSRYPAVRGQGITICLKEQAPDPTALDLRGRLRPSALAASLITPHATQMATLMVGVGNSSPLNEGVAPESTLIPASFSSLLPESDAFYSGNHVTIVNHSYGTTIENIYGAEAVAYDASTYRLPALLHVFSAGNLGDSRSPAGRYANLPGVATLTGNAKMAKNNLVVGAIDAAGTLLASSSRGPAYDGRLKPELVAYGEAGSSGAAALTSGVTALLQQAYKQQKNTPSPAALLKAILINTADDVGTSGPDFQTGYGSINAFAALKTIEDTRYLEGTVAAGRPFETSIQVPTARRLKITVVWTDPPAALNSTKALVNDLDLTVSDGRTTWYPWVLNASPNVDSLRKPAVRMRDTLNNVEQVTLDAFVPGAYTIRVTGRLSAGTQPFALAYQWETPGLFTWTTPNAAGPVVSDTTLTLRWTNTTAAPYGTLEFSADQGQSWTRTRDSVALAPGSLTWHTPDGLTTGQLRMRIAGLVYPSDTFRLSPVSSSTVLYACADSLAVTWTTSGRQPVPTHRLYRLAGSATTWEDRGTLAGNRAVLTHTQPDDWWAIAPVSPTGEVGIRSEPFSRQQVSCYYRTLTATLIDGRVEVNSELSTTEGVARITFQKQTAGGLMDLGTQPVLAENSTYFLLDSLLQEGPNLYRIQIQLTNGTVIYSDFATAYVLRKTPFLLFPNPVMSGRPLAVQAAESGIYVFRLTDGSGRVVSEYTLLGTEATLPTSGLPAGLYTYVILREGQCLQSGKLLIE